MYTADEVQALRDRLEADGASKAEIVKRLAWACLGWPYVYGTYGQMCTRDVRRKYAGYHPEYKAKIYNACPVLSGKQETCDGCQWQGRRCFDCRGFTRWLLEQVGLQLSGGGATSQWDTASNWAARGEIGPIPLGLVCCVFKRRDGKMSHTGMHVGGIEIVHCSTVVKAGGLGDSPAWTHWAVPAGLYSDEELREAGINVEAGKNYPVLRKGSTGLAVEWLQLMLNEEDGAGLKIDGNFGQATEDALKHFQKAHGLTADGVCGPKTWSVLAALEDSPGQIIPPADEQPGENEPEEPDAEPEKPPDTITMTRTDFLTIKACVDQLTVTLRKYGGI